MLGDFLDDTFGNNASDVVATILTFVLILILTWLVRLFVTAILPSFIKRLTSRTITQIDDQIIDALRPPVRFLITIYGLWVAMLSLQLPDNIEVTFVQVMESLVAFGIFWAIFRGVDPVVAVLWHLSRRAMPDAVSSVLEDKLTQVLRQVTKGVIFVLGFAAILEAWGYDVAGLVAGLGLAGAAVALAVKDTLANLFGYFVILADEPFHPGEYVVFDDVSGTVEHIGFRTTRIRGLDQSLVIVPNNTVINANVINWSRLSKRRLNMTLGLEYRSSPEQVLSVVQAIRHMLDDHELVFEDSAFVQFVNFNESSLDILILCFMKTPGWNEFQAAKQDINLRIMDIVEERGVGIAFPSRTVFVEHLEPQEESPIGAFLPAEPEPIGSDLTDAPVPSDAANDAG